MFCPSCGAELIALDQKFCQNCGCLISTISEGSQSKTIQPQYTSPNIIQTTEGYVYVPVYQQKPIKKNEPPGPYSKKCLGFAIISAALVYVGYNIGSSAMDLLSSGMYPYLNFPFFISLGTLAVIIILINCVGLIFGIFSKIFSSKAKKTEPVNSVAKLGSIFSILGIIFNSTSLVVTLLYVLFSSFFIIY